MARIRTLKPEFWTSEQVVDCSRNARLLMIGMLNFADDRGVLKFSARTIRGNVFPMDDDLNSAAVLGLIRELLTNGLVGVFIHNGVEYIHILGFQKHQRVDKPNPKYPAPPKSPAGYKEWSATDLGMTGDLFDDESRAEGKGMESKGREGKGRERGTLAPIGEPSSNGRDDNPVLTEPEAPKPGGRGWRLPDDWKPGDEVLAWGVQHGFTAAQVLHVAGAFVDYWRAQPGGKGVKLDWDATFRNWLRREDPAKVRSANGHDREAVPDDPRRQWRTRLKVWDDDGRKFWPDQAYGCTAPPSRDFFQRCPPEVAAEFGLTPTSLMP